MRKKAKFKIKVSGNKKKRYASRKIIYKKSAKKRKKLIYLNF